MRRLQTFLPGFLFAVLLSGCNAGGGTAPLSSTSSAVGSAAQTRVSHAAAPGTGVQFAYVTNFNSNTVSAYTISVGGALTQVAGSPFAAGTAPREIAVDPTGRFAYVANSMSRSVSAYSIDASSGVRPGRRTPYAEGF